ncbi:hypothetical protein GCM10010307_36220 [Streptomyces vastus]|uniref:FtsK domain-containing protein n=1 Tax=Streptomyces vastus TaxID=285451 RepID=A0ABN3QXT1_9ACTN
MFGFSVRVVAVRVGRPGLALVELSFVEQRYRAVLAVLAGATVTEVAASLGVSRQTVSGWKSRYEASGLAGLAGLVDRSRRPVSCPHQASAKVEAAVSELRRRHPRWGPRRIAHVLERAGSVAPVPSRMTVYRILVRHGLVEPGVRRRKRSDYKRWQRSSVMDACGLTVPPSRWRLALARVADRPAPDSRVPRILRLRPTRTGLVLRIKLRPGQDAFDVSAATDRLRHSFGMYGVTSRELRSGVVELRMTGYDVLKRVQMPKVDRAPMRISVALREDGSVHYRDYRSVPHGLTLGATESGKSV